MQGNWENAFLITRVRYKRVLSHTFNCDWGEEYHSLYRSVGIKGLDRDAYRLDYYIVYVILLTPVC